jgi:hypothetical protein
MTMIAGGPTGYHLDRPGVGGWALLETSFRLLTILITIKKDKENTIAGFLFITICLNHENRQ